MSSVTRNKKENLLIVKFGEKIFKMSLSDYLSFVYLQQVFDIEVDEVGNTADVIPLDMRTLERDYQKSETLKIWDI